MKRTQSRSEGFTLIATLLMLVLMSGMAIGLLMMVNTEQKVGNGDLQNNLAYHHAEGGIEHMTSDLASLYKSMQAPSPAALSALSNNPPIIPGVTWKDYRVTPMPCNSSQCYGQIQSGPNQGLWAQITPVTLLATAAEPGNQEVSMMRTVQVALIPVFQFGVFSESDLGFFSSPNLEFKGRVHTNNDLYVGVANSNTLKFHDKITAYGNVVRAVLPNGLPASSYNDTGTVLIPTASQGCDGSQPACRAIGQSEGSVTGAGGNPPQSGQNTSWPTISLSTYNGWIIDGNYGKTGGTGATNLSLPFVAGTNLPYEIIRRAPAGEPASSALGGSRMYNLAQIRVSLSDDPSELPGGVGIRLYNGPNGAYDYTNGVAASVPTTLPSLGAGRWYSTYFAEASTAVQDTTGWANCMTSALGSDWAMPGTLNNPTRVPNTAPVITPGSTYNLIDGWLKVEYQNAAGNWVDVTDEWLRLGFARGLTPPTAPGSNPVNPNAILLFQRPADRNGNGVLDAAQNSSGGCKKGQIAVNRPAETPNDINSNQPFWGDGSKPAASPSARNNWYPINFYDTREGNPRDTNTNACTVNGVMNAVELDVGNLQRWLAGQTGTSGPNVDYQTQNGYVLYFSDRRGMLKNPNVNPAAKTGDSGLEDTVNSSSSAGAPDNQLDPIPNGKKFSPEDVNHNGVLDNFGEADLGDGFAAGNTGNGGQYTTLNCISSFGTAKPNTTAARKAWVSGARHVLKLVDGSFGNLPVRPDNPTCTSGNKTWTCKGGFTVASENPVYIQGDYNSNAADTIWNTPPVDRTGPPYFASAAVVADAVTVLSNNWSDLASFANPTNPNTGRVASTTYYRVAVAAGKSINFPFPNWESATNYGTGTDGGVHNFLRFLENWSNVKLNYYGSLVSLYYSTYNTGMFKCCTYSVYEPPTRNYIFDSDFAIPQGLPPGTPMFRDVNNLSYRQIFTSRNN